VNAQARIDRPATDSATEKKPPVRIASVAGGRKTFRGSCGGKRKQAALGVGAWQG